MNPLRPGEPVQIGILGAAMLFTFTPHCEEGDETALALGTTGGALVYVRGHVNDGDGSRIVHVNLEHISYIGAIT